MKITVFNSVREFCQAHNIAYDDSIHYDFEFADLIKDYNIFAFDSFDELRKCILMSNDLDVIYIPNKYYLLIPIL